MSDKLPLPNILRIELLDGKARERYLGGVQRTADVVKQQVYQKMVPDKESTFYGFIKQSSDQTYGMSAGWDKSTAGGGILGSVKKGIKKIGKAIPAVGAISGVIETSKDVASDITGINAKVTGSNSMKRYSGSELDDFEVTCGWYLPEQFLLCIKSLKILHRMTYQIGRASCRERV